MFIQRVIRRIKREINYVKPLSLSRPFGVIFLYHTIETEPTPWTKGFRYPTPFDILRRQIDYIEQHFDIESTSALVDKIANGRLQRNSAAIHFDDGFRSVVELALPLFKERKKPFTLFPIKEVIQGDIPMRNKFAYCLNMGAKDRLLAALQPLADKAEAPNINLLQMTAGEFLSWVKTHLTAEMVPVAHEIYASAVKGVDVQPFLDQQEIVALKDEPLVELGSHTISHQMLSKLSVEEQRHEILGGHAALEDILGKKLNHFAYPFGGTGHFDEISQQIVRDKEGLFGYSCRGGINYSIERTDIRRISLSQQDNAQIKTAVISGMA